MATWQEELNKKFNELKKEEHNATDRTVSSDRSNSVRSNNSDSTSINSPSSDNSSGSRGRDLLRGNLSQKTSVNNNERRMQLMITSKGALDDYEAICKETISEDAKIVKIFKVVIKLLLGIRTNQQGGVKHDTTATKTE